MYRVETVYYKYIYLCIICAIGISWQTAWVIIQNMQCNVQYVHLYVGL